MGAPEVAADREASSSGASRAARDARVGAALAAEVDRYTAAHPRSLDRGAIGARLALLIGEVVVQDYLLGTLARDRADLVGGLGPCPALLPIRAVHQGCELAALRMPQTGASLHRRSVPMPTAS